MEEYPSASQQSVCLAGSRRESAQIHGALTIGARRAAEIGAAPYKTDIAD